MWPYPALWSPTYLHGHTLHATLHETWAVWTDLKQKYVWNVSRQQQRLVYHFDLIWKRSWRDAEYYILHFSNAENVSSEMLKVEFILSQQCIGQFLSWKVKYKWFKSYTRAHRIRHKICYCVRIWVLKRVFVTVLNERKTF